jgi:hypothetical protein
MVEFVRFAQTYESCCHVLLLSDVHVLVFQIFRGLGLEYDMSGLT